MAGRAGPDDLCVIYLAHGSHASVVWQDAHELLVAMCVAGFVPRRLWVSSSSGSPIAGGRTACLSLEV